MPFSFTPAEELRKIAASVRTRRNIASSLLAIAANGDQMGSFEVTVEGGRHFHNGVLVGELVSELEEQGYKAQLNIDSSDRTYHFDIFF